MIPGLLKSGKVPGAKYKIQPLKDGKKTRTLVCECLRNKGEKNLWIILCLREPGRATYKKPKMLFHRDPMHRPWESGLILASLPEQEGPAATPNPLFPVPGAQARDREWCRKSWVWVMKGWSCHVQTLGMFVN